ncbi:hypothetical protein D9758_007028 [Tetrapyrgos nigripes]|uniref:F-box domain-containing protein n=1 Tax=Tetrapyrgos nigripes TaxID=182062 RepID=A0A8H5GDQ7_9AGAR|nr:hypothetical protein D9758_007028 [Tetrapyrgos nigripes]
MLSLPSELLEDILEKVERLNDRKTLRLTCSRLALILRPFVLKEITLNIHKYKLNPGLSLLRALASPDNVYSQCVRTLYIDSLAPSFFPDPEFEEKKEACNYTYQLHGLAREWVSDGEDQPTREYEELRTLLEPALQSLKYLMAVRWRWHHKDEWAMEPVMQLLPSFRSLREFSFCAPLLRRAIPFPEINTNLKVLSIDISLPTHSSSFEFIAPLIRHLLSRSKCLSSLHFDVKCLGLDPSSLLNFSTLGSPQRSLITHLSLGGWSRQAFEIPNYFPNLTSLQLRSHYGNTLEPLFSGLQSKQIHLQRLVLDIVTEPVLDYIATYSGLEVLSLKGPKWYSQPTYNENAERFYQQILPLHNDSLVKLEMEPEFESRWCFGEDNVEAISRCRNLRVLSVRVAYSGLPKPKKPYPLSYVFAGSPDEAANPVHLLLQTVSSKLPDLHTLYIDSARDPSYAHDHSDFMIQGAQRCRAVRSCIEASIKDPLVENGPNLKLEPREDPYDLEVLKWVRIFVGQEKVELDAELGTGY